MKQANSPFSSFCLLCCYRCAWRRHKINCQNCWVYNFISEVSCVIALCLSTLCIGESIFLVLFSLSLPPAVTRWVRSVSVDSECLSLCIGESIFLVLFSLSLPPAVTRWVRFMSVDSECLSLSMFTVLCFVVVYWSSFPSPWYDLRGWLGVKQQLFIYLSSFPRPGKFLLLSFRDQCQTVLCCPVVCL